MSLRVRFAGPLKTLDAAITIDVEVRIKNSLAATVVLAGTYNSLALGQWTPLGLVEEIGEQLALWLRARLLAAAGVTGVPASADAFDLRVEWIPAEGVNATLARWFLGNLDTTLLNGLKAQVDYIKIKNTSNWGAILGLLEDDAAADRTVNAVLNGAIWEAECLGLWQPKSGFTFKRAEKDSGDYPVFHDVFTQELRDGTVNQSLFGSPSFFREYGLIDQKSSISGPMYILGEFSSLPGSRKGVTLRVAKKQAQGMLGAGFYTSRIVAGRYVMIGGADPFVARIKAFTPATGLIDFYEKIPAGVSTPEAQSPVMGCPEVMALKIMSLQQGGLGLYEADSITGSALFYGGVYSLRGSGDLNLQPQRRDFAHPLYSSDLDLVRHGKPSTNTP